MTVQVVLGFGSNVGHREETVVSAVKRLADHPDLSLIRQSTLFSSPALINESLDPFINAAAVYECSLEPHQLLELILETENFFGRDRSSGVRYTARTLDIDIILFGRLIIDTPQLRIPHPEFTKRKFVLYPLQQIALNYEMPEGYGKLSDIISRCPDRTEPREI